MKHTRAADSPQSEVVREWHDPDRQREVLRLLRKYKALTGGQSPPPQPGEETMKHTRAEVGWAYSDSPQSEVVREWTDPDPRQLVEEVRALRADLEDLRSDVEDLDVEYLSDDLEERLTYRLQEDLRYIVEELVEERLYNVESWLEDLRSDVDDLRADVEACADC